MLKKRIIPVLLWDGVQCVKPVSFERPYRKLGSMEQYVNVMELRNIDELIILDIEASNDKREPNFAALNKLCSNLFCPVTYGGGISSLDHIRNALENGADKVCIRTHHDIIPEAAAKFGRQAIVYCLETDNIMTYNDVMHEALEYRDHAGELLLVSREKDGTMEGYEYEFLEEVISWVDIPVICCGGCSDPIDMIPAFELGASACAAGSMFLYTEHTPRSCALELAAKGIDVRVQDNPTR